MARGIGKIFCGKRHNNYDIAVQTPHLERKGVISTKDVGMPQVEADGPGSRCTVISSLTRCTTANAVVLSATGSCSTRLSYVCVERSANKDVVTGCRRRKLRRRYCIRSVRKQHHQFDARATKRDFGVRVRRDTLTRLTSSL